MRKFYLGLILFFVSTCFHLQAQVAGNTCSDPLVAQLCGAGPVSSYIDTFTYHNQQTTLKVGNKNYITYGYNVYYQVNLPTSSYNPVSLTASLVGDFSFYTAYSTQIYFFWYEDSPCTSSPTAVDSVIISGTSGIHDSLSLFYPVQSVQSQYYLVVAFQDADNYQYSLQFGYNNSEPLPTPICSAAPPPYKGTMTLDQSKCYTPSNPYHLPLADLLANPSYNNVFYPLTQNQNVNYFPINDGNGNGYIISLMRTDANNTQSFTSFDQFPYTYSNGNYDSYYSVGITVFFKNNGGAAGIKGFRLRMVGGYNYNNAAFPDGQGYYDSTGNWNVSYDANTTTYTWLFTGKQGRGDNTSNDGYSCKVYTFTGQFQNLGDSLDAWYLSDEYGNDSIQCVYGASNPPRTDCGLLIDNYNNNDWIQFIGNGNGGGAAEGQECGSNQYCNAGTEFMGGYSYYNGTNCTDYLTSGSNCSFNFYGNTPYIYYDSLGCATEIVPQWNSEFPDFEFTNAGVNGFINAGKCNGKPYPLILSGNGCYSSFYTPTYLVYHDDSAGSYLRPVDSLGNINYNVDLQDSFNISVLPTYPCNNSYSFTIPLSKPGTYSLYYTVAIDDGYYYQTTYQPEINCSSLTELVVVNDSNPKVILSPASDTTICAGNSFDVYEYGASTYTWWPDSTSQNYYNDNDAEVFPKVTAIYTVTGTDMYGCTDTVDYKVNVKICPPVAAFYNQFNCGTPCNTYFNRSTNSPTQWLWSFPKGNPSSYNGEDPPLVCYPAAGLYTVKLVVSNSAGKDSIIQNVIAGTCGPIASFTANDSIVCNNGCITFYNHSFNGGDYYWFFPGGNPSYYDDYDFASNNDSVMVCYADTGSYRALLTVSNDYYGTDDTFSLPVKILNCHISAHFTSPDTVCSGQCITYTNTSFGNPTSWQWSFAGGTPSSYNGQTPPVICYNGSGHYVTRLITSNNTGSDTTYKIIAVNNCVSLPTASFTAADSVCRTSCITYTNTSSLNATSWVWSFPGGNPSSYNGQNPPTICYNDTGNYTTQLITSNTYGADTFTQSIRVNDCFPYASFIFPDSACKTDCIIPINSSSAGATSYQWTFSGGVPSSFNGPHPPAICYDSVGIYSATLITSNSYGTDTSVAILFVYDCSPHGHFHLNDTICQTDCITLDSLSISNVTSWQWTFGGGTPSSFNGPTPPTVCFDSIGTFAIQLIAGNSYGADTFVANLTVQNCKPEVSLSLPDTLCAGHCVVLTNQTALHITSWYWQFPGGKPSSFHGASPPPVCYDSAGSFPVSLIVSNPYGSDTLYLPDYVYVKPFPPLLISVSGDTLISSPEISYQWFLNNNAISGATNQTLVISQDGSYTVGVTDSSVCSDFLTITVTNLGVNSISPATDFTISPNPNNGVFHIDVSTSFRDGTIEVYDILGERVVISNIKNQISNSFVIDLSNQADGVYFVKLQTENGMVMKKVVVAK